MGGHGLRWVAQAVWWVCNWLRMARFDCYTLIGARDSLGPCPKYTLEGYYTKFRSNFPRYEYLPPSCSHDAFPASCVFHFSGKRMSFSSPQTFHRRRFVPCGAAACLLPVTPHIRVHRPSLRACFRRPKVLGRDPSHWRWRESDMEMALVYRPYPLRIFTGKLT